MKIGINASFARKEDTGIGQYTINLINALISKGGEHSFCLYFEDRESPRLFPDAKNIKKRTLITPLYHRDDLIRKTAWERALLPREIKREKPDVFFSPYNAATLIPLIAHVMTLHDVVWKIYEKDYLNNFRKNLYAKQVFEAVKRATHLITVSEYSKKEIVKHLGIEALQISVVKNGVSKTFQYLENRRAVVERLQTLGIDVPYIFYIGGFEKRKNVDLLLSAFRIIVENYGTVLGNRKLVIAGHLWDRDDPLVTNVKKMVAELGISDHVILLGSVRDEDRVILYNGADLLVFPSLYEGFGMTVVEAMASGCPVLASARAAVPEIAKDAAEYFNPDREDELVQHLIKMLSDSTLRSELSRRGIYRAMEFSWETAAQKTLDIFNTISNK